jgi:hypothetical protein
MDNITEKLSSFDISNDKIYQINGINYTKKEFYEKIKNNIKANEYNK